MPQLPSNVSEPLPACPGGDTLRRLLRDELAAGEVADLAKHFENCPPCRRRLDELSGAERVLPAAPAPVPSRPSAALRAVMEQLRGSAQRAAGDEGFRAPSNLELLSPPAQPGFIGRFASYDVMERIASGGMGVVFKALDRSLNRVVAIKVLAPTLAASESARIRFLREARAAAAVAHENVVAIHAVGEERGLPYLVMQFIAGQSLEARLRHGPLELAEILRIGLQIAHGLAAAHAQGLIHRDVKPGNILLENGVERVKLTDFGLARAVDEPGVTKPGVIAGTPEFMSPEQARGERLDARGDLFSLGTVLYMMATGTSPFAADSSLAVLRKVCELTPPPPHEVNARLPAWFGEITTRLLAKAPSERFQTAAELERLLGGCLAAVQSGAPLPDFRGEAPESSRARPHAARRRSWARLALPSLLLVGAAIAFWLWPRASPPGSAPAKAAATVLRPDGTTNGVFDSLAAAVTAASSGDVIEISGAGFMHCEPVSIRGKSLRLRAAATGGPVLLGVSLEAPLIFSDSPLVIEGLELRAAGGGSARPPSPRLGSATRQAPVTNALAVARNELVSVEGAPVFLANCRFDALAATLPGQECLRLENSPRAVLVRCEFYRQAEPAMLWTLNAGAAPAAAATATAAFFLLEQCVVFGREAVSLQLGNRTVTRMDLTRNTFVGARALVSEGEGVLRVEARRNIFDVAWAKRRRGADVRFPVEHSWRGSSNFYSVLQAPRRVGLPRSVMEETAARDRAAKDTASVVGVTGFGLRLRETGRPPNTVSLADFRLRPGQLTSTPALMPEALLLLGADLDRVGPGPAYAAWRRSPEYSQWLAETRPGLGD